MVIRSVVLSHITRQWWLYGVVSALHTMVSLGTAVVSYGVVPALHSIVTLSLRAVVGIGDSIGDE